MKRIILMICITALIGCNTNAQEQKKEVQKAKKEFPVSKTEAQWKAELDAMEYYVLRQKGTERPGNNEYNKFYEEGIYLCAGCGVKLYESQHKYDSGSGWPAFDRGIKTNLEYEKDASLGVLRTEVHCANCGGHLGHVFDDGPKNTTGLRHCINSAALDFIPKKINQ
ncbi:MAG: peptide-methionine (R)-S-oxide reductase MsrB [Bacteroidota bacterium]